MDDLIRAWMTWEAGRPTWPGRGPLVAETRAGLDPAGIEALERRLGVALPPSYRRFLAVSDGWTLTVDGEPEFPTMLPAAEVGWVRDTDPHLVFVWDLQWSDGSVTSAFHEDEASYLSYTNDDPVYTRNHHLRGCLQIGRFHDFGGVVLLLNPLVRDLWGEWEVWELGSKNPGARRFPSFGDWMMARLAWQDEDVPEITPARWRAAMLDVALPVRERVWAGRDLLHHTADAAAAGYLASVAVSRRHRVNDRVHAIAALEPHPSLDVVELLDRLADDRSPTVRAKAMERLAWFGDEERRERIVDRLDRIWQPHRWKGFEDVLFRSWERTRRLSVLEALLELGDQRVLDQALVLLASPDAWLSGLWPSRVGRAVRTRTDWERLVRVTCGQPSNVSDVGPQLEAAGHPDLALVVYRVALATKRDASASAVMGLAAMASPEAEEVLACYLPVAPGEAAVALRRYDSPRARMAVRQAASMGAARMACVAFEEMRAPEAGDELWALWLAEGLRHAIVSLGRRRDRRVLPVARDWLRSRDTDLRHLGVECLRDLGAPDTFDELQALLGDADVDVAVVAAHALVMIDPVRARTVLAALAPADPGFAGLLQRWLAAT